MLICPRCNKRDVKELFPSDAYQGYVCASCLVVAEWEEKERRRKEHVSKTTYTCFDATERLSKEEFEHGHVGAASKHLRKRSLLGIRNLIRAISNRLRNI